jgi:hypothetical protein
MNQTQRATWERSRAKGKWRYVFLGLLRDCTWFLVLALMLYGFFPQQFDARSQIALALGCLIASVYLEQYRWTKNEREYHSKQSSAKSHPE